MNDLERAAAKFKDYVEPTEPKRGKGRKGPTIPTRLRADQYRAIWRAIQVVGYAHQSHMYSGDGSLDKMYTEMANEVGEIVLQILRGPNFKVKAAGMKGGR